MENIKYYGGPALGGLSIPPERYEAARRATEEEEILRKVYYYVPLADRPIISKFIVEGTSGDGKHWPGYFNCAFLNWAGRLAQATARNGFPVTSVDEYVKSLRYYRDVSIVGSGGQEKTSGLLSFHKNENFRLDKILEARYRIGCVVFSKEEKEAFKQQFELQAIKEMISARDWEGKPPAVGWQAELVVGL
ncbi:hypothetical protein EJ03DRAFT_354414 [Teratosphaeria nubilosa]|uniref:Uncharacterized protein n=1 Tax=Teratosphaeria nubilosa TaxID=161662 RepID=A0A6G1L0N5_9PEZI|nr:hypothetical protein EJ03DRAFT_354414 [Teratosphaeria nubilosa]